MTTFAEMIQITGIWMIFILKFLPIREIVSVIQSICSICEVVIRFSKQIEFFIAETKPNLDSELNGKWNKNQRT